MNRFFIFFRVQMIFKKLAKKAYLVLTQENILFTMAILEEELFIYL